jgi:hypothetical protein
MAIQKPFWIPACAGMTGWEWIPAFAGMTGEIPASLGMPREGSLSDNFRGFANAKEDKRRAPAGHPRGLFFKAYR